MNTMIHKGYAAHIEFSDEDECFVGHIAGIQDVVGFHGESVSTLRAAFCEAVDDYVATCIKLGREPQKPYSGRFNLRVRPELHARLAMQAEAEGKSLNQWVAEALEEATYT
jgi:predicted HicB family RNase H-like nuclease